MNKGRKINKDPVTVITKLSYKASRGEYYLQTMVITKWVTIIYINSIKEQDLETSVKATL